MKERRFTIGYIAVNTIWGIGKELLLGALKAAEDLDLNMIQITGGRLNSDEDTHAEINRQILESYSFINPENLDGLVIWTSSLRYYMDIPEIESFLTRYAPLPMISISMPFADIPSILIDDEQAMKQVMRHLIVDHKFRKIGFIRAKKGHFSSDLRFNGYKKALEEYKIPYRKELVAEVSGFEKGGEAAEILFKKIKLKPKIDIEAVVGASDTLIFGMMEVLKELKINIPEDISIIGFNNKLESRAVTPALTTVEPNFYQHGYEAVKKIKELLNHKKIPHEIIMPAKLIIRQSCGCFEHNIENAKIIKKSGFKLKYHSQRLSVKMTAARKKKLLYELYRQIKEITEKINKDYIESLFFQIISDTFFYESNKFLLMLEGYINQAVKNETDLYHWHILISEFRRILMPYFSNTEEKLRVDDLCHQARVLIDQSLDYVKESTFLNTHYKILDLVGLSQTLNSTFNISKLRDIICRELPSRGIKSCYMYYNENQMKPDKKIHLQIAYDATGNIKLPPNGQKVSLNNVIKELNIRRKKCLMVLKPFYYQNNYFGFGFFEMGPFDALFYENLRGDISIALRGALIIKQRDLAKDERDKLFETLKEKNLELEDRSADLKIAMDNAKKANQAKSQFLANMSHEIRTPLNSIMGLSEMINESDDMKEMKNNIQIVQNESGKLMELINQVLDISKIEAGKMKLHLARFDLYETIDSLSPLFKTSSKIKGINFIVDISKDVPRIIDSDQLKLRQILINLLGNAVKFTLEGEVKLTIDAVSENQDSLMLMFKIKDTGIGIPWEHQNKIFDLFTQAEGGSNRKFGGTGLGTAISKQFVDLMGGDIGLESEEGKGSTFWFTIKCNKIFKEHNINNKKENNGSISPRKTGRKQADILLVEDYKVTQKIIKYHLSKIECRIVTADNGKEAIEMINDNKFDLILMDIQMPEMDGYEATRFIRKNLKNKSTPIIALTANVFNEDIKKCYAAGMNDFIKKPIDTNEFFEKISFWLKNKKKPNSVK